MNNSVLHDKHDTYACVETAEVRVHDTETEIRSLDVCSASAVLLALLLCVIFTLVLWLGWDDLGQQVLEEPILYALLQVWCAINIAHSLCLIFYFGFPITLEFGV